MSFYNNSFLSIWQDNPLWSSMPLLYDGFNVNLQLYAKGLAWSIDRKDLKKTFFYFLYVKKQKHIFNQCLSNVKSLIGEKLRAEPTIFSWKKISFSLKLLSGHFICNPALRLFEVLQGFSRTVKKLLFSTVYIRFYTDKTKIQGVFKNHKGTSLFFKDYNFM